MDTCKVCGRKNPLEDANFCYYCGASFREGAEDAVIQESKSTVEASAMTDEERELVEGKPFSKWKWMLTFLLLLIPVYGWLAFVVVLAIGAFGSQATKERKEMSRGMLLFLVVAVIVLVVEFMIVMNDPEYADTFQKIMDQYSTNAQ